MIGTTGAAVLVIVNLIFASALGTGAGGLHAWRFGGIGLSRLPSLTQDLLQLSHSSLHTDIGDRGCPWCLGVWCDADPSYRLR